MFSSKSSSNNSPDLLWNEKLPVILQDSLLRHNEAIMIQKESGSIDRITKFKKNTFQQRNSSICNDDSWNVTLEELNSRGVGIYKASSSVESLSGQYHPNKSVCVDTVPLKGQRLTELEITQIVGKDLNVDNANLETTSMGFDKHNIDIVSNGKFLSSKNSVIHLVAGNSKEILEAKANISSAFSKIGATVLESDVSTLNTNEAYTYHRLGALLCSEKQGNHVSNLSEEKLQSLVRWSAPNLGTEFNMKALDFGSPKIHAPMQIPYTGVTRQDLVWCGLDHFFGTMCPELITCVFNLFNLFPGCQTIIVGFIVQLSGFLRFVYPIRNLLLNPAVTFYREMLYSLQRVSKSNEGLLSIQSLQWIREGSVSSVKSIVAKFAPIANAKLIDSLTVLEVNLMDAKNKANLHWCLNVIARGARPMFVIVSACTCFAVYKYGLKSSKELIVSTFSVAFVTAYNAIFNKSKLQINPVSEVVTKSKRKLKPKVESALNNAAGGNTSNVVTLKSLVDQAITERLTESKETNPLQNMSSMIEKFPSIYGDFSQIMTVAFGRDWEFNFKEYVREYQN